MPIYLFKLREDYEVHGGESYKEIRDIRERDYYQDIIDNNIYAYHKPVSMMCIKNDTDDPLPVFCMYLNTGRMVTCYPKEVDDNGLTGYDEQGTITDIM